MEINKEVFRARAEELSERVKHEDGTTIVSMLQPALAGCDPDELSITLSYPAMHWERNAGGVIHGGITGLMMDTTMGVLAYAIAGGMCPTMNLNISYPRPAPGDGTLLVKAKAAMVGRSTLYMTAEMWDDRAPDKVVALANGVFHDLHQPLFQQVDTAETLAEAAK